MNNHSQNISEVLKMIAAWLGVLLGHVVDSVTVSNIALLTSIIYSVVNVWVILERRHHAKKD